MPAFRIKQAIDRCKECLLDEVPMRSFAAKTEKKKMKYQVKGYYSENHKSLSFVMKYMHDPKAYLESIYMVS